MNYVFAVVNPDEFAVFRSFSEKVADRIDAYISYLKQNLQVFAIPNCIVLASSKTATELLSSIPIPAYTNDFRTVFCPELSSWKDIYLQQITNNTLPEVRSYYEKKLTENHLLQVLGHEFTHHSELFLDEAFDSAQWFEEGMCEYISRKYFLSEEEFREEARINALLVAHFEQLHGRQILEAFCADTYGEPISAIFYFYWKSFLTVEQIMDRFDGDLDAVFREYHRWFEFKRDISLSEFFAI